MEDKKLPHPELDVTKFVNVSDKPYDIYIDDRVVRHFEPGEDKEVPIWIAKVGAKHLVDKILSAQGVKDTNRDTAERQDTFALILPDIAEAIDVRPLSDDERQAAIDKRLDSQDKELKSLRDKAEAKSKQDDKITKLEKEIESLKKAKVAKTTK